MKKCPLNRMGKEAIVVGPDGKAQINEEVATDACQVCVNICPYHAIHMVKLPDKLTKRPTHRYGKDSFILYNMPVPQFGKVVGIVGVNGIGKSTAIKILAGVIKPNLGEVDQQTPTIETVIQLFKGTEAQNYFQKVKEGKIQISYKPQEIELIPKARTGKVRTLLERVDQQQKLIDVASLLDIAPILDNDIATISGGELQRVAIAAAVLKEANVYIFDEPSSYLDVKQRIKVARFIRSLANEQTSVMVIEHDLIVMDYIADLVHIMYGEEKVYGIVATVKAAKAGINTYLDGYLPEDNVRFRNHKITFEARAGDGKIKPVVSHHWPAMEKRLGKFHLTVKSGSIYRKEIVGIVGPNGIGKTTFMKLLAGVEAPDRGNIEQTTTIAYKPQTLQVSSPELVMLVLQKAVQKHTNDIINPLKLHDLLTRPLNTLSGGELQRVAIARALAEDAQLILLDEPSAYLDTEQRLILAKIIRQLADTKEVSILVVDHDLLFLDYLSDRLLVFEGEPAREGRVTGPHHMEEGMNTFLRGLNITFRRDEHNKRPRANKEDSQLDRTQRATGKWYYTS